MTECTILKSFPYSKDGFTTLHAVKGEVCDIPDGLVPGLTKEGYVASAGGTKAISGAPENKMVEVPENKEPGEDIAAVRDEYQRVVGRRAYHGWDINELKAKIAEHGNG